MNEIKGNEYTIILENRLKKLDAISKISQIRTDRMKATMELRNGKLQLDRARQELEDLKKGTGGWNSPVGILLQVAQVYFVDNDKSLGTEPALRSIWNEEEMNIIRAAILKKIETL